MNKSMTSKATDSDMASSTRAHLPYSIFLACLVAVGIVSHTYMQTDGPLGIVVGLAIVAYTIVSIRRASDDMSEIKRFIGAHPVMFVTAGLLVLAIGLLDTSGWF